MQGMTMSTSTSTTRSVPSKVTREAGKTWGSYAAILGFETDKRPSKYGGSGDGHVVSSVGRPSHPATFAHARIADVIDAAFGAGCGDRQALAISATVVG